MHARAIARDLPRSFSPWLLGLLLGLAFVLASPAPHACAAPVGPGVVMPTVPGPIPDGILLRVPSILANRTLAERGFVDVTASPFLADPTGAKDATRALQDAIDFARDRQMVCYLPSGTYKVSRTLDCAQPLYKRTNGNTRGARFFPCLIMGARGGKRPVIRLAPFALGFSNPRKPAYVIRFWARSEADPDMPQSDINMNQGLVNVDIEIGPGNAGAVGIRHKGAQGSLVQECRIDATHGYSGFEGGIGAGGMLADVTVVGGNIGLDLRETEPGPMIVGLTLINQKQRAIFHAGRQALTLVGVRIRANVPGPLIETRGVGWSPHHGVLCLVDAEVECEAPGTTVIRAESSLVLRNVRVRGARTIVTSAKVSPSGKGGLLKGAPQGWMQVDTYALGVDPPAWKGYSYTTPVYRDGKSVGHEWLALGPGGPGVDAEPRDDPVAAHLWPREPLGPDSPGLIDVRDEPYYAHGNGMQDDADALQAAIDAGGPVFVPKGVYMVSRPLRLHPDTRIVGAAPHLTWIMPMPGAAAFADPANPQPVIETADTQDAATEIAFLGLYTPPDLAGARPLHWRCGGASVLRNVAFITSPPLNGNVDPGSPPTRNTPLVLAEGHAGGRWYGFYQESWSHQGPDYRHLLIRKATGGLALYMCNQEHARSDANMEIVDSDGVAVYGMKGEGNHPILRIANSRHVRVYGYGGNGAALEGKALFQIRGGDDILLAGLVEHPRLSEQGSAMSFAGRGVNPDLWHMISETAADGEKRGTPPLVRPPAYAVGGVGPDPVAGAGR